MTTRTPPIGMARLNMEALSMGTGSGFEVWDGSRWIAVLGLRVGTVTADSDAMTYGSYGGYEQRQTFGRRRLRMDVELTDAQSGMWPPVDNRGFITPTVTITAVPATPEEPPAPKGRTLDL